MEADQGFPKLVGMVLDTTDARGLAEFYRQLLLPIPPWARRIGPEW
jgi:hypothetical protein